MNTCLLCKDLINVEFEANTEHLKTIQNKIWAENCQLSKYLRKVYEFKDYSEFIASMNTVSKVIKLMQNILSFKIEKNIFNLEKCCLNFFKIVRYDILFGLNLRNRQEHLLFVAVLDNTSSENFFQKTLEQLSEEFFHYNIHQKRFFEN